MAKVDEDTDPKSSVAARHCEIDLSDGQAVVRRSTGWGLGNGIREISAIETKI
jgi:hypothetical protein